MDLRHCAHTNGMRPLLTVWPGYTCGDCEMHAISGPTLGQLSGSRCLYDSRSACHISGSCKTSPGCSCESEEKWTPAFAETSLMLMNMSVTSKGCISAVMRFLAAPEDAAAAEAAVSGVNADLEWDQDEVDVLDMAEGEAIPDKTSFAGEPEVEGAAAEEADTMETDTEGSECA